jgi:hypothetical protein
MPVVAPTVYLLCLLTSAACGFLLVRAYLRNRSRLLLWSAVCFVLLALNNLFVVFDLLLLPTLDLSAPRLLSSLAAIAALLYGFVWEVD